MAPEIPQHHAVISRGDRKTNYHQGVLVMVGEENWYLNHITAIHNQWDGDKITGLEGRSLHPLCFYFFWSVLRDPIACSILGGGIPTHNSGYKSIRL